MLTDASGKTQYAGGRGGLSTSYVTATAAAMYAQETVIVDADADGGNSWFSDGATSRQVITWKLMLWCVGISLVLL